MLALAVGVALATGCATPTRRTLEVPSAPGVEPGSGPAIAIVEVRDGRRFVRRDPDRSHPQLITGGEDQPAVTARSMGQFTTAGGKPLWDFLLPEGQHVTDLVREALARGFRMAGMRVVEEGSPGAIPVTADILQLWSWNTGSWTFTFHFQALVALHGQIPSFADGDSVSGKARLHSAVAGSNHAYQNLMKAGLDDLANNLRDRLVTAGLPANAPVEVPSGGPPDAAP